MQQRTVSVDQAIALLNECLTIDPQAIDLLFTMRVGCNRELAAHPTVQVAGERRHSLGILGLLNGLFGVDSRLYGAITAVYDENATLIRFQKTEGFEEHATVS